MCDDFSFFNTTQPTTPVYVDDSLIFLTQKHHHISHVSKNRLLTRERHVKTKKNVLLPFDTLILWLVYYSLFI